MKVSAAVAPREAVDSGKASFVATAAEADAVIPLSRALP